MSGKIKDMQRKGGFFISMSMTGEMGSFPSLASHYLGLSFPIHTLVGGKVELGDKVTP